MRYDTRHPAKPLINEAVHHASIAQAGQAGRQLTSNNLAPDVATVNADSGLDQYEFFLDLDLLDDPDALLI